MPPWLPDNALFMLAGWVLTILISGWSGYRWGLRSQRESEKLKARIDALAIVDNVLSDIPKNPVELWLLFGNTQDALKAATFRFSCQLKARSRLKIEKALNDYQGLGIIYMWPPTEGRPNSQIVEKEHKAMFEALKKLRHEITNA